MHPSKWTTIHSDLHRAYTDQADNVTTGRRLLRSAILAVSSFVGLLAIGEEPALAVLQTPACASAACSPMQTIEQPESKDATGKITVEGATIYIMKCANVGQIYIYQYSSRPGFRAIHPGDWGRPIGGRDFATCDEAIGAAATTPQDGNAALSMNGPPVPDAWGGWDVNPGHIRQHLSNGAEANFTWSPLPQSITADGFSITLTVQAQSVKNDGYSTGIGIFAGSPLTISEPSKVGINPTNGASDSQTITVTVKPAASFKPGEIVSVKIGAYWGPGVTYRYKVGTQSDPCQPSGYSCASSANCCPGLTCYLRKENGVNVGTCQ